MNENMQSNQKICREKSLISRTPQLIVKNGSMIFIGLFLFLGLAIPFAGADAQTFSPVINSVTPKTITPGDVITISGYNFGSSQGSSELSVGGYSAEGTILSWTDSSIQYKTSEYYDDISMKVGVLRCNSATDCLPLVEGPYFNIQPQVLSTDYSSGAVGDIITINGKYLKNSNVGTTGYYYVNVLFNGVKSTWPAGGLWTSSIIEVLVPANASDGYITVEITGDGTTDKVTATGPYFDVVAPISNDTNSSHQTYLKQISMPEAWPVSSNRRQVVVAVIDDGVYSNHPDLKNRMWQNTKEIVGNNVDDDNNGYIDDAYGWNYVDNTKEMTPLGTHGTMVAGIIGAETNNAGGIAGINWNVKFMPLIICENFPSYGSDCADSEISKAIRYAADNGAEVINLSFGSNGVSGYTTQIDEAIKYANGKNVLIVAAAGNGDVVGGLGYDLNVIPQSPVCNDNGKNMVIGVGAVDAQNIRTSWSNYGSSCVDIYAPGEEIISTSVPIYTSGYFYDTESGTSFSAPIVTGVVSLLKAANPTITNQEAITMLVNNSTNSVVNAYKTLTATYTPATTVVPPATIPTSTPTSGSTDTNNEVVTSEMALVTRIDTTLVQKMKGYILLQVEAHGEAWYVNPKDSLKYYLQNGVAAYAALRKFGLGITNADIAKIPVGVESRFADTDTDGDGLSDRLEEGLKTDPGKADTDADGVSDGKEVLVNNTNPLGTGSLVYNKTLVTKLKGRILLQVESHGEAWYLNPKDGKRYYMTNGDAAYQIMRFLSLGITNLNLRKIGVGSL
jgi:subtilisin family serine protease